ncbi:MAG: hypothetical protein WD737_14110 [Gemmatimonadota bacterium]
MTGLAILLLLLAGLYVAIERGQSPKDRVLRWMVIAGALILAFLLGSGTVG